MVPSLLDAECQDAPMEDDDLRTQIYKCLNLRLSRAEATAIRRLFDDDGNGSIDGAEFVSHFCKIGQFARRQRQLEDIRYVLPTWYHS